MTKEIRPENDVTKLSVPQVVLLCLLLTTVASVATAIVVVQLVANTPGETVFQTIERITETRVETPIDDKPQTIVIKEGDLIAKAVASVSGSSQPLYVQSGGEVIELGHGFKVSPTELLTMPMDQNIDFVTAGLNPVSHRGADKVMLWQTTDESTFTGPTVAFIEGSPQVGQTVVYVGGNGSFIRASITSVSNLGLEISETLEGKGTGILMDVGGDVIGFWNGSEVIRSNALATQVDQLRTNPLYEPQVNGENDPNFELKTNPEDTPLTDKKSACELLGGEFNEYNECAGINADQCLVLGGDFVECGSACRHDPEAKVCTLQCVIYCQL